MTNNDLFDQIKRKRSFLCVGLDVDLEKIPPHLLDLEDPLFAFSKAIIDATAPYAVAFKPNIAFFETYGLKGWQALEKVMTYLNQYYPDHFTIADAKRGDIGNTSTRYAKAFFETMNFDAITVAPYMGEDSVAPFLAFENKHTILLALTSNKGAQDFQLIEANGIPNYQQVITTALKWENNERLMFVVGATKAESLTKIRELIPDSFLLVPGVGAQGGSLSEVAKYGMNSSCGLLVNSSRGIIYSSKGNDFEQKAAAAAQQLQLEMDTHLLEKGII